MTDCRFIRSEAGVTKAEFTLCWDREVTITHVVMKEQIAYSQRIEEFEIMSVTDYGFETVASGSVVGHKKRVNIVMAFIGVY